MKLIRIDTNISRDVCYKHKMIARYVMDGSTYKGIAYRLNVTGLTTRSGNPWTSRSVQQWNHYNTANRYNANVRCMTKLRHDLNNKKEEIVGLLSSATAVVRSI